MSAVRVIRRTPFRVHSPEGKHFSPEGACFDFQVEAYVEGGLKKNGTVVNVRDLDQLMNDVFTDLRQKKLPVKSPEIAETLFHALKIPIALKDARLVKLRLIESPDLWFDVWA